MAPRRIAAVAAVTVGALTALPASALAALDVAVTPAEARFGTVHRATGKLTDAAGAPLAGRRIALQKRDYPYRAPFRSIGHATTAADGTFSFTDIELDRNADLRVVAFDGTTSGIARAWTYPDFTLRYRPVGTDQVQVTQRYVVPDDVRLTAPTIFYFGNGMSTRSSRRVRAKTQRIAAGQFMAVATVKLPKGWNGRFRYASCFKPTARSQMGNPARGCPARFSF